MNDLERFLAVARGEKPDYTPIFGFRGPAGVSSGCLQQVHENLVRTGMPKNIGGIRHKGIHASSLESWQRYWGVTEPVEPSIRQAWGANGFRCTKRVENGYEILEWENGASTRQIVDGDQAYSMPEFERYPVRDRDSWEFYRERTEPREFASVEEIEEQCRQYDAREKPLCVSAGSAYGTARRLMGPEEVSFAFHDNPDLVHEIVICRLNEIRQFVFPLIERLKPEIVKLSEDLCFNHGMLLSPEHFHTFFGSYYREVCDCARANNVPVVALDTDGCAMEFIRVAESYGVNGMFPWEVKAGNDLFELRKHHPMFVFFGWLEKEVLNEGNEHLIEPEIMNKVPRLLEKGRYFPNADHMIQPMATFSNMCRFMTLLHEACGNPEGEYPRTPSK